MRQGIMLIILGIAFSFTNCGKPEVYELPDGQAFEGWHGPPNDPTGGPKDYFYMKYSGRASEKSRKKKSGVMMQNTCTDAAELSAKGDIIQKLAHETVTGASSVVDGESAGKTVVREFAAYNTGMNRFKCKPIAKADPNIPMSEWNECTCVMYVRVEGGAETVLAKAVAKDE